MSVALHHYMYFEVVAHHVPHTTVPANRPHRPVSAPPKRSPRAETGQPVRTPHGVRGRRLTRRQKSLRPAARPPLDTSQWASALMLQYFKAYGAGDALLGRCDGVRQATGYSRDGGRAGSRSACGSARARHSIVMVATCHSNERQLPRMGVFRRDRRTRGQAHMQTCNRLKRQRHRQSTGLAVRLADCWPVTLAGCQTGHQARRFPCGQANMQTGNEAKMQTAEPILLDGEVLGRLQAADPRKFFNKDEYLGGMGATTGIRHLTFSQPYA